jgi:hypothetical protein
VEAFGDGKALLHHKSIHFLKIFGFEFPETNVSNIFAPAFENPCFWEGFCKAKNPSSLKLWRVNWAANV